MGWFHDTGYGPAYLHEGLVVAVAGDGRDLTRTIGGEEFAVSSGEDAAGWRAGCACGWRDEHVHRRADYPGDDYAARKGMAPDAVDGFESDVGAPLQGPSCYAAWEAHLRTAVPELAVHDALSEASTASQGIEAAVAAARAAGASWGAIGEAAGEISRQSAWERWRHVEEGTARAPQRRTRPTPVRRADSATRLEQASGAAHEATATMTEAQAPDLALALRRTADVLAQAAGRPPGADERHLGIAPGMALHDTAQALTHLADAVPQLAYYLLDEIAADGADDEDTVALRAVPDQLRTAAAAVEWAANNQ